MANDDEWLVGWTSSTVNVNGIGLRSLTSAVKTTVSDAALIIFVPGWASTTRTWKSFMPTLSDAYKVIYLETREKVYSRGIWSAQEIRDAASDVAATVKQTNHPHVVLVGASTGANLCIEACMSSDLEIEKLVLLTPHSHTPIPRYFGLINAVPASVLPHVARLIAGLAARGLVPPALRQQRDGISAAAQLNDIRRLRASASAWKTYVLNHAKLSSIETDTLVIAAKQDDVHPVADASLVAASLPNSIYREQRNFASVHSSRTANLVVSYIRGEEL